METARIAELLAPYLKAPLLPAQLYATHAHLELLLKWNAKMNLTSIRDPEQIVPRHFGESLFAAQQLLNSTRPATVIDLGSGAGFPGLPLAIYAPDVQVTLIESQAKKATFLKEAVRVTGAKNVRAFNGRAEDFRDTADLVIMRAVEKISSMIPSARQLMKTGGRLALLIGRDLLAEIEAAPHHLVLAGRWEIPQSEKTLLAEFTSAGGNRR